MVLFFAWHDDEPGADCWRSRGNARRRAMLGKTYDWFTEWFDTADLIDAKALLEELAE